MTAVARDDADLLRGASDLARADDGALWAVPERQDALARADVRGSVLTWTVVPLRGKPAHTDGEALAWIDAVRFAIGTERHVAKRSSDLVLFGALGASGASIERSVALPYALWGMVADDNKGIEGLCVAQGSLFAGVETPIKGGGAREAPIGRLDLASGAWTPLRARLSSEKGTLSALACRPAGAGVELWILERHYGTARWLRAVVAPDGPTALLPTVYADLAQPIYDATGTVPNLEGIAADADPRAAWFVADNDSGGRRTGATLLVRAVAR